MSAAQRGFLMVALAFPIYLLWKGELPAYLKLMSGALTQAQAGTSTMQTPIGGGSIPVPTIEGIMIPPFQTQAAPGSF